jgi:hypothetical protein
MPCAANGNCGRGIQWIMTMEKKNVGRDEFFVCYGVCGDCKEIFEKMSEKIDKDIYIVTFTRV